jgi:hypothetical protein
MDRRGGAHDGAAPRLLKVFLEKRRQFYVHAGQLLLVDADDEGHQPEDELAFALSGVDQSLAGHPLQRAAGRAGLHASPGGDIGGRLTGQPQHTGQSCLLRREDLRQQSQFHAALSRREAVGDGVESLGQFAVNVLSH